MFKVGRVAPAELRAIARASEGAIVTYPEVGATLAPSRSLPAGYRHDRESIALSGGRDPFERGADGLRQWAAHLGAGLIVEPRDPPAEGATVAVAAPVGPMTAVAICRVIAVVDEADRYGFAYGTLPGHPEIGEEAFLVERTHSGVTFTLVAFSRPSEVLARLGGPVTRAIQRRTSRRYLDGLASYVDRERRV